MKVYIFTTGSYDEYEKFFIVANDKEEALKTMVDFVNYKTPWKEKRVVIEDNDVALYWGENHRIKEMYYLSDELDLILNTVY